MAIIKDPYEISVWGTESVKRTSASNNTLTYINDVTDDTLPLVLNIPPIFSTARRIKITVNGTALDTINFAEEVPNFYGGEYYSKAHMMIKSYNRLVLTWKNMAKSTRDNGHWRYYTGIKDIIDLNKRNSANNKGRLYQETGESSQLKWSSNHHATEWHFFIGTGSSAGRIYICPPDNWIENANQKFEIIYPLLTTQEFYLTSTKPNIIIHYGTNTITAGYSTANSGTSFTSISNFYAPSRVREYKICVIGTDTLNSKFRAVEPRFVENINGTHTFTFKMYYVINGENSPYTEYLFNEQRIKLKWKNEWYDLVIKNVSKDSSDKSYTYTCKDLYENELSKTGYNLIFDNELQNNQGTVEELARRVVQGTDWSIKQVDTIKQEFEEPVYEIEIASNKQMTDVWNQNNNPTKDPDPETGGYEKVPADPVGGENSNRKILLYYSVVQDLLNDSKTSGTKDIQFAYSFSEYETELNSQSVINENCYSKTLNYVVDLDNNIISFSQGNTLIFTLDLNTIGVSSKYRATRLVDKIQTIYDPIMEKYVEIYKASSTPNNSSPFYKLFSKDDIIYHYTASEFDTPQSVNNLIVNNKDFLNLSGWNAQDKAMTTKLYPTYNGEGASYNGKSYLMIPATDIINRGLNQYLSFLSDGIQKGDKFVLRYRGFYGNGKNPLLTNNKRVTGLSTNFKIINSAASNPYSKSYIELSVAEKNVSVSEIDIPGADSLNACIWREAIFTVKESLTKEQLATGNYTFYFKPSTSFWLKEMEFFPLRMGLKPIYDENGKIVYEDGEMSTEEVRMEPGDCDFLDLSHIIHYYYNKSTFSGKTKDSISYIYKGEKDTDDYNVLQSFLDSQTNQFNKIGTINVSKSNRFNILQEIAQVFKCWCRFEIEHSEDGRILNRAISFVESVGQETGIGFEYGTDLRSVSRAIQSEQFTTKIIVPNNANQFGENGFCSIQRSLLNYPRVNYILNFDYYINRGFIDEETITNDLYNQNNGLGYYTTLNTLNLTYDAVAEQLAEYRQSLSEQESVNSIASKDIISIEDQINNLKDDLANLANQTSYDSQKTQDYITENMDKLDIVTNRVKTIKKLDEDKVKNESLKITSQQSIEALKSQIASLENRLESITNSIEKADAEFLQKYSGFIREGTWQDESYYDDDRYYLAAQEVAYTSSRPQVSYNISVIRLSALEDFRTKVFEIGDIVYVQDVEFFGYMADGLTPYKELVVVSEITSYLDEPDKDNITVQNYRTQFEDLFQRITASVQALQYNEGSYNKVAGIITTGGALNQTIIEKSFSQKILNYTTYNENIKQDNTGITVSDITTPNLKSWLSPTGIKITEDGGETWKNVINGKGIETNELKSGTIYTQDIMIMDRDEPAFRWNEEGITAYEPNEDGSGLNQNKFTRFDHYGIYGIDQSDKYEIVIDRNFGNLTYYSFDAESGNYIKVAGGATPVNGITYYTLTEIGNPIEITNFINGENYYCYYPQQNVYRPNIDSVPKYGALYYTRIIFEGSTFDNYEYYEYNSEGAQYFPTEDAIPLQGKTYYRFEYWDGGFKGYAYPTLYKLNNENYELLDENTTYTSELTCYIIEVDTTMPGSFNPGVTYYKENNGTYIINTDTQPLQGARYAIVKNYSPTSEENIWEAADYGLTWNGFFLKSRAREGQNVTGRIEISSTEDIRVKYKPNATNEYRDRIIIGRIEYEENDPQYGIQINDENGMPVLVTSSSGNLWLRNILHIGGDDESSDIKIGYFIEEEKQRVFSASTDAGSFKINADGTIEATNGEFTGVIHALEGDFTGIIHASDGEFTGEITATGGSIGGFTIDPNNNQYMSIISDNNEIKIGNLEDAVINANNNFIVYMDGSLEASKATIYGEINAINGSIGGFEIGENLLSYRDQNNEVLLGDVDNDTIFTINNGRFEIQKNGSFTALAANIKGTITATSGSIGGVSIGETKIKAGALEIGSLDSYTDTTIEPNVSFGKSVARVLDDNDSVKFNIDENGNIYIVGSITATNGSFTGNINANSGTIGGFAITQNYLNLLNQPTGYEVELGNLENNLVFKSHNFTIDKEGKIYAEGAEITGKISANEGSIGGFSIAGNEIFSKNEEEGNNNFLRLNSNNSTISGRNFIISPDLSSFENVTINGSLHTSVFEAESIHAVGGAMIFRPAFSIKDMVSTGNVKEYIISVTEEEKGIFDSSGKPFIRQGDYLIISCSEYGERVEDGTSSISYENFAKETRIAYVLEVPTAQPTRASSLNKNQIKVTIDGSSDFNSKAAISIVVLDSSNRLAVGISSGMTTSVSGLLEGEGLTISKLQKTYSNGTWSDTDTTFKPTTFLGNLGNFTWDGSDNIFNMANAGYGLYSDNVFLKGALVTVTGTSPNLVTAGVNTNSLISPNNEAIGSEGSGKRIIDESPIIFWGGAQAAGDGTKFKEEDIVNSKFFVTSNGTLYANQGYFTGTIITESIIEASEIRTARIFGTSRQREGIDKAGLILYNGDNIISFRNIYNSKGDIISSYDSDDYHEEKTIFNIGTTGFSTNNGLFISIEENAINFNGTNFTGENYLAQKSDSVIITSISPEIYTWKQKSNNSNLASVGFKNNNFDNLIMSYNQAQLILDDSSLEINNTSDADISNIYFGKSDLIDKGNLKFSRKVVNDDIGSGFDIYVV